LSGTGDVVMTDVRQTTATLLLPEELEGRVFIRTPADAAGNIGTSPPISIVVDPSHVR
jgi:hypothetical protein